MSHTATPGSLSPQARESISPALLCLFEIADSKLCRVPWEFLALVAPSLSSPTPSALYKPLSLAWVGSVMWQDHGNTLPSTLSSAPKHTVLHMCAQVHSTGVQFKHIYLGNSPMHVNSFMCSHLLLNTHMLTLTQAHILAHVCIRTHMNMSLYSYT